MVLDLHYTGYPPLIGLGLAIAALVAAIRGKVRLARNLLVASSISIIVAWIIYEIPFLFLDYSLLEVYRNTSPGLPWWLRLAAAWATSGGSLFLFATMVSASTLFLLLRRGDEEPPQLLITGLPLLIIGGLIPAYLLGAFDPLGREAVSGAGLNPLLKSFWMYPHPLTTFSGYALLAAASLALLVGYQRRGHMIFEVGWALLTIGILVGGYWSYETFGWGGYWAWDPVENGQLMVWLAATLYPHLAIALPRLRRPVLLFIISTVFLSMFITRTGLSPLHSFGAPGLGALILLGYTIGFFVLSLYVLSRESFIEEVKGALKRRNPYHVGMLIASAALGIAALFVFSSLFLPSILVALGQSVNVPQMSSGIAFYHPVLYPILIVLLASLPLALLGDKLGWRGSIALLITTSIVSTLAGVAALLGKIVLAPLTPITTNALMAFGLPWAAVAAATALVDAGRRLVSGLRGLVNRMFGIDLLHLGMALTALGVLLSGTYSFNDFYFYEYAVKPGEPVILPGGIKLSLVDYSYSISDSVVDIYTGYVGRYTTYFLAWEGLMALTLDLADILRAYEEGKKIIENNVTIQRLTELARKGVIELDENVTSETVIEGSIIQRNFAANTTIWLPFIGGKASLIIKPKTVRLTITPQFDRQGALVATNVGAWLKAEKLTIEPIASPIESTNISGVHNLFELRLSKPAKLELGNVSITLYGASIVSADLMERPGRGRISLINNTLTIENAYLSLNATIEVNGLRIRVPSSLPRGVSVYMYLSQNPDPYVKALMESDVYDVLTNEKRLTSILSTPECLAVNNCFGYIDGPRLVPETAWLELDLRIDWNGQSVTIPVKIRFEAYGEVQGIHGLVPVVVHPIIGLDEMYIVVYPPTLTAPIPGAKNTFHELLVYYLSETFKTLPPEKKLALAAIMAAGYYSDILRNMGPQQRPFMLEQVLLELYLAAEKFNPENSTIVREGIQVKVKIVPGVVLVWLGPTIMALSAIYTLVARILYARFLKARPQVVEETAGAQ